LECDGPSSLWYWVFSRIDSGVGPPHSKEMLSYNFKLN
jgi:hypothetical protein